MIGKLTGTLAERNPELPSLDTYALAKSRDYAKQNSAEVLASFRRARRQTVARIAGLDAASLERRALFEGYGWVTVRGLVHYLCSHDQQHLAGLQWLLGKMESP